MSAYDLVDLDLSLSVVSSGMMMFLNCSLVVSDDLVEVMQKSSGLLLWKSHLTDSRLRTLKSLLKRAFDGQKKKKKEESHYMVVLSKTSR